MAHYASPSIPLAMPIELTQSFYFEAAHTLRRYVEGESEASRRIHGHTYHAEITLRGEPDPATGMVMDLGLVRRELAALRERLDHRFLDEVEGIGPATLENLCGFIARALAPALPLLVRVSVFRPASGDRATLHLG
ncbi:MAG: 6-carboxy-5,6,7,8-tetrahydropterin synthase [Silanimonas sp.]|nr:MAG: 6-carboxy-5,6,7,8-tetrahydropterin synthase [Silanimonas sp.]